jgi:hypothetical protein
MVMPEDGTKMARRGRVTSSDDDTPLHSVAAVKARLLQVHEALARLEEGPAGLMGADGGVDAAGTALDDEDWTGIQSLIQ